MAQGIYKKTSANICIAITGNAGPSLEEGTKDSIAYYTILINKEPKHFHIELNEDSREKNIFLAIEDIYKNLFKMI
jgi:nicotinamide-nucleotide amidase